jgi:hypothetical protein
MRSRCNWRNIYRNLSFANRTTRTIFFWTSTFLCNTYASSYWQRRLYLLCRGAIFRSSKWCKTIYNDATNRCKSTTTFLGRLYTFGRSDLSKSTPNSYAIYNTTNKPKTRTHEGPFNIYKIIEPVHWHTGHIPFFLYTLAGQVDFLRFFFLNSSWTGHIHFFTQTISFLLLFCSTVDWALSLFYKFNCWANRYFEEGKKMHRPINLINIEQSLKKKC